MNKCSFYTLRLAFPIRQLSVIRIQIFNTLNFLRPYSTPIETLCLLLLSCLFIFCSHCGQTTIYKPWLRELYLALKPIQTFLFSSFWPINLTSWHNRPGLLILASISAFCFGVAFQRRHWFLHGEIKSCMHFSLSISSSRAIMIILFRYMTEIQISLRGKRESSG